jgi:ATP-dependent HslUV protease ATP-binding subunit HslU
VRDKAYEHAITRLLDALLPTSQSTADDESPTRKLFREKLLAGELDDKDVEIDVADMTVGVEIMAPPGMEEVTNQIQNMISTLGSGRKKKKKMKVKNAFKQLCDEEALAMVNEEEIRSIALETVEQHGIVFIDELDKITQRGERVGGDVSREGVQRDLLPLVEGCAVSTKYGIVKTDHILFIASGAFHLSKPSDLVPELQGRFPIRVELNPLSVKDFVRILTEPKASLVEQYIALLATEGVKIEFNKECIKKIAEIAFQVNEKTENIGARRLYTIMEKLLDEISFTAPNRSGEKIKIDAAYVNKQLAKLVKNEDLTRYIL